MFQPPGRGRSYQSNRVFGVQMQCCGWTGRMDWNGNMVIMNSSQLLFPCSCQNVSATAGNLSESGFCEAQTPDWPVYDVVSRVFFLPSRPLPVTRRCRTLTQLVRLLLFLHTGLRRQRGELAPHQHRRGAGNLPGCGPDRGKSL